ncbi:MAG: M48 family metallopeptidase [Gemmatimonadetes bacterium]|nr:M48 family metallopeptidase [Gemmatimonadota bacterium]MDE3260082.1 M48 family metallopeptidase [Gemmatimonadota bacterium]
MRRLTMVCLVGSMASCATIGRFNVLSTEQEVEIGREAAREIERDLRLYNDPAVTAYINSLGQMLARYSSRSGLTYYFKVVDTDEVNAFALPGGWLYVNRGLITTAENESELAGVIGHEIGHVDRKHGARAISRQFGAAVIVEATLGGENASVRRQVLRQVVAVSTGMGQLKYGRDAEREADQFAVESTYAAGIDPEGTATFFQKLVAMQKKEPGQLAKMFSTHPPSRERVENVRAQIGGLPPKAGLTKDSRRFQAIKDRILKRERVRRGKERRRR